MKNRVGVVVNTSVHKSAAKRNFWKRQAKAALLPRADNSHDFLVVLFSKVNTLTKKKFRNALQSAAASVTTHQS